MADRVTFAVGDAAGGRPARYDLVTIFEALHDMGDPVGVLRDGRAAWPPAAASSSATSGWRTSSPRRRPIERLQYAFSVLHCLPATRAEDPVEARRHRPARADAGALGRRGRLRRPEVLPIENDFWRFYRLRA